MKARRAGELALRLGRRVVAFLLALVAGVMPLVLSGCWDLRQLEEYLHVGIVGIDRSDTPGWIKLTILVVEPVGGGATASGGAGGGGGGGGSSGATTVFATATAEAPTFTEATAKINRQTNRLITYSHLQSILFGEDFARSGISPIIDTLSRYREIRRSIHVLVADTASAEDVLTTVRATVEVSPATYITEIVMRNTGDYSASFQARVHDLLLGYNRLGQEIVLPLIRLYPKPPQPKPPEQATGGEGGGGGPTGGSGSGQAGGGAGGNSPATEGQTPTPVQKRVEISGLAFFQGDKLVAKADVDLAQGWNLLAGRWRRGFVTIQGEATLGQAVRMQVAHYERQVKIKRKGQDVRIDVKIKVRATIDDIGGVAQVVNPNRTRALISLLESKVRELCLQSLNMAKVDVGGDVFDFALPARRTFRTWSDWENYDWNAAFRRAEFNVEVTVLSIRAGLSFEPPLPHD